MSSGALLTSGIEEIRSYVNPKSLCIPIMHCSCMSPICLQFAYPFLLAFCPNALITEEIVENDSGMVMIQTNLKDGILLYAASRIGRRLKIEGTGHDIMMMVVVGVVSDMYTCPSCSYPNAYHKLISRVA